MKILAVVGSPRLKGNTNYLVDEALREAAKLGAQTEKIIISQYDVRPCLGCDNCSSLDSCVLKDDASWILDKFCRADGVIMATPVYYYNVTAQMKAFIDRNYFLYRHDYKNGWKYKARAAGVIVVGEQMGLEDTIHTLKQFIDELNVDVNRIFFASGYANKPGEVRDNLYLIEDARTLGRRMVKCLKVGTK